MYVSSYPFVEDEARLLVAVLGLNQYEKRAKAKGTSVADELNSEDPSYLIALFEAVGHDQEKKAAQASKEGYKKLAEFFEDNYFICMLVINKITIQQERRRLKEKKTLNSINEQETDQSTV